jgi:hypothetical protein
VPARERLLLDLAGRAVRRGTGTAMAVLLADGASESRSIPVRHQDAARILAEEAAAESGSQLLLLTGGDMVLLTPEGAATRLFALSALLGRLLPNAQPARSWGLGDAGQAFLGWCTERAAAAGSAHALPPAAAPEPAPRARSAEDALLLLKRAQLPDLVRQGTAIRLVPRHGTSDWQIVPAFHRLIPAIDLLLGDADQDLARHVLRRLAPTLLQVVGRDKQRLTGKLHLSLPAGLAAEGARLLPGLRIEVPWAEAVQEPALLGEVPDLVLTDLPAASLPVLEPALFGAALVLVRPPARPSATALAAARALPPGRVGLMDADSPAALTWGVQAGMELFCGDQAELVLAAARMARCTGRAACTALLCRERAQATGVAGRRACTRPDLLDDPSPLDVAA